MFKVNGRNFESKLSSTQWCLWINYLQSLEHNIETVLLLRTFWTWQVKFQVNLIIGSTPKYPENIPFLTGPLCTTSSSRSSPDRWSPPIHDGQRYPSGILGFLQRCHEVIWRSSYSPKSWHLLGMESSNQFVRCQPFWEGVQYNSTNIHPDPCA